jgi:glycosyltransferase involved in cell wall biosynthesis
MIFNLSCLCLLRRLIHQGRADLIYLSGIKLTKFLFTFGWLVPLPLVYEVHGLYGPYSSDQKGLKDRREERVFSRADGLVVTTEALKKVLNEVYGVSAPVARVPLGFDIPREAPAHTPRHSPKEIFYIGQLYPLQGVDLLIEAMKHIEDGRLNIVGGKKEEIETLKARAENLKVAERVKFHGFVEPAEVKEKMAAADVLVLPSRSQGKMPYVAHMKLFEYMAAARPIVATNLPSINEFVRDGEEAILVEPDSALSLAEGIRRVLEDDGLAQRLAAGAYGAAARFTWASRARLLADFFHSILERRREGLNARREK